MFQYVMQTVPGLVTWMQGYTAYNLLLDADSRGVNPWDHPVVHDVALPKSQAIIGAVQQQRGNETKETSGFFLDDNSVYMFDGKRFQKTSIEFKTMYDNGSVDNGFYYTIWPTNTPYPDTPPPAPPPGLNMVPAVMVGRPEAGDLCFLSLPSNGQPRRWLVAPLPRSTPFTAPEILAAQNAMAARLRSMSSQLQTINAFDQLTDGWQLFAQSVHINLNAGDRDGWKLMPKLEV